MLDTAFLNMVLLGNRSPLTYAHKGMGKLVSSFHSSAIPTTRRSRPLSDFIQNYLQMKKTTMGQRGHARALNIAA
jgi:hypothetical protein